MRALARALSAETLKLRGTLALWMCLVAPAVVVGVYALQIIFSRGDGPPDPQQAWQLFVQGNLALWAFLMLPLFVTLQAALLAALEHSGNQWKHLLALPTSWHVHYLAKLLALGAMLLLAHVAMGVLVPLGGALVMQFKPSFGLAGAPPWGRMLEHLLMINTAALMLVALHTWISIRWRSFAVAVGVGMSATVMGFLIGQSAKFGPWYPWSLPVQVLANRPEGSVDILVYSLAGALLATVLGLLEFMHSEPA